MFSLIFDRQRTAVRQLTQKIRIEPVLGCLQPEGSRFACKISHPESHLRQSIEKLRTLKLFCDPPFGRLFRQLTGLGSEVMLLKLKAALIHTARLIAHGLEVNRSLFGHSER